MEKVTIELPTELLKVANPSATDLSRETARLLALGLFREGKVSLERAAELCHSPVSAFMDFVAAHNTPPIRSTLGELEEDRRILAELGL
jgi:predicted HTH domain antitoxin